MHDVWHLPATGLTATDGNIATPHEMFFGRKPLFQDFWVFGCPVVCKKWTSEGGKDNEQTERGMRGIFIGFTSHQKGFLVYTPGSYQIMISGYLIFDESFSTAIVATWQQRHDSLALWPLCGTQKCWVSNTPLLWLAQIYFMQLTRWPNSRGNLVDTTLMC